jgi:hypothetical protein
MVIWRSLSPSVLARVLEMTAAPPVRQPAVPNRQGVNDTSVAGKPIGAEPQEVAGAKSVPGE